MRIFNRTKTKELQMYELNLNWGRLVSQKLRIGDDDGNIISEEDILVYTPEIGRLTVNIKALKAKLSASDYKAIKFAEGELSAEEYQSVRLERREWRRQINEMEDFIKGFDEKIQN
jgi:hypothetical protein